MALATKCSRLFHPVCHLWLRAIPMHNASTSSAALVRLEIGLTERGVEDIGDVTSIQPMVATVNCNRSTIAKGQEILQIHYEGHCITKADELYHTVWETYSDKKSVHSPVAGQLLEMGDTTSPTGSQNMDYFIDDDTVLVANLITTKEEWEYVSNETLVQEATYLKVIGELPRGNFADHD